VVFTRQAGGLATQSVDILLKDAFLLCGSTRKTLPPHLLGVNERFKTLPAHGTLVLTRHGPLTTRGRPQT